MKKKPFFLLLLSAGCLFTACSNEDKMEGPEEKSIPVVVNVTEEPMQAISRAAVTTTGSLEKFYMDFYSDDCWNHYTYRKSGSGWSSTLSWLAAPDSYPITFYAYHDSDTEGSSRLNGSSNPYLSVSVEENASTQHDVIVAMSKTFTYGERGSTVNLSFNHICSAVQFNICKTSGMSDYDITVKEVKLCNVIKTGDYYYKSGTWDLSSSTTTDYTLYSTDGFELTTASKELIAGDDYMFMIPQTLTPWDKISTLGNTYIRLRCKITKNGTYKIGSANEWGDTYLAVGDTWQQGKKHTVTLHVGTALRNASGTQITKL